jgi:hypothetical protein
LKAQRQLASSRGVAAQASQQATPGSSQQQPDGRFPEDQLTHDLSTARPPQEQALLAGAAFDEAEHQLLHDALCAVDSAQALHDDITYKPALDDTTEASLDFEASYAGSAEVTHDVIPASWHSPQRARPSPSRNPLAAQLAALSPERQRQQLAQQQQVQVSPAKRRLSASELVKHIREAPPLPREERPRLILSPARAPAPRHQQHSPQTSGASPGRTLDPRQELTAAVHSPAKPADLYAPPSRHASSPARQDQQPQQDQEEQQILDATDTLLERCRRLLQGASPPRSASAASASAPAAPKGSLSAGASPSRRRVDWQQVLAGNASASSIGTSATTSPARSRAAALPSSRPGNGLLPATAAAVPVSRPAGQGMSLEEIKAKYLGMQQAAVERRQAAAAPAGGTMPGVDVGAVQGGPSAWREKLVGGTAVAWCCCQLQDASVPAT